MKENLLVKGLAFPSDVIEVDENSFAFIPNKSVGKEIYFEDKQHTCFKHKVFSSHVAKTILFLYK